MALRAIRHGIILFSASIQNYYPHNIASICPLFIKIIKYAIIFSNFQPSIGIIVAIISWPDDTLSSPDILLFSIDGLPQLVTAVSFLMHHASILSAFIIWCISTSRFQYGISNSGIHLNFPHQLWISCHLILLVANQLIIIVPSDVSAISWRGCLKNISLIYYNNI